MHALTQFSARLDSRDSCGNKSRESVLRLTCATKVRTIIGPCANAGPMRFLPPAKKVHLWWEYRQVQVQQGLEAASWPTYLRALRQMKVAKLLRIRKTGCHVKCTECELYKRDLRSGTLSLSARAQTMDRYTAHIVQRWLDRQVYENLQDLSRSCLSAPWS